MDKKITEAEWKIMRILWNHAPITLKEIIKELKREINWSNTTVRTLVVRLMEKEFIGADKTAANFKYYPLIDKGECQVKEAKNLINTVFEGSMEMLITAFDKKGKLSGKELEELKRIIDKIEE
ncbi:BlaI/MecI/CopY family transcriptional regulator [Sporanaerobium hydrogeniformans]|uniref:BlaI/MecI/CopY family transcriptional regulator n=1 Tax=Sporanaerobium hydrogeniformans TaxID=3072179 RepID=UPI0015D4CCC0|nr:BlaI/MecI/CopY family transcriptional regulator [Sporanaerobium hydrogeniformans]